MRNQLFTKMSRNVRFDWKGGLLTVGGRVDGGRQLFDLNFESLLNLVKHSSIFIWAHECNGETLSSKSSGTADSVEVGVSAVRHVVVEHNIDLLNIDASAEDLGGDQDAVLERLESLVDFDSELGSLDLNCPLLTFLPRRFHDGWLCLEWRS